MLQLRKAVSLDSIKLPFREALPVIASMGAEGIEINARTGIRPNEMTRTGVRQIRKWLDDYRLKVACVYFPTRRGYGDPNDLEQRLDGTRAAMKFASDLGCNVVSNRIGKLPDESDFESWSVLVSALHDLGNFSLRSGAWLAARSGVNSGEELSKLFERLPNGALQVDFDPAELMIYGFNTVEVMKAIGQYVSHFRARDAVKDLRGGPALEVQLGRGTIEFGELFAILEEHQYQGFVTLERTGEGNLINECSQGLEYLDNLFR